MSFEPVILVLLTIEIATLYEAAPVKGAGVYQTFSAGSFVGNQRYDKLRLGCVEYSGPSVIAMPVYGSER